MVFTDTAKTIALPPDSAAERDALQTAFMNCTVFTTLYEGVAKGRPVEAQLLGAKAVHELGISPGAADRFAESFIESAIAAGLAEADNDHVVLRDPGATMRSPDSSADEGVEFPEAGLGSGSPRVRLPQAPPVVRQEWKLPAGAVVLEVRLDRPLPAGLFAQVGAVAQEVEALADRLRHLPADELTD